MNFHRGLNENRYSVLLESPNRVWQRALSTLAALAMFVVVVCTQGGEKHSPEARIFLPWAKVMYPRCGKDWVPAGTDA